MLQKTFEIVSREEAVRVAETLRAIPEAAQAGQALLQAFVFRFSHEEAMELLQPIREAFPELIVTGMSIYAAKPPTVNFDNFTFDEQPTLRLGFFFFERAQVRAICRELDEGDPDGAVDALRGELAATPQLKGVRVALSGFSLHISAMLERLTAGFEDVPFFGTMADVYYVADRNSEPFIFDARRKYLRGALLLLFTGEDLHVDVQYIFGWKPIGKPMSITPSPRAITEGDTAVAALDGVAPEKIYRKYLGIRFDEYLTYNCCEFPLIVERNGLMLGRTPFAFNESGDIIFIGSIRPEETVRFSYTVRDELLANTERRSREMADFCPQAVELFACGNRSFMLRDDAVLELECFRRFAPDTLHCSAAGEIYYYHGRGGFLNSALVAIGMREGSPRELRMNEMGCELIHLRDKGMIPLSERILMFLQAMSGDLLLFAQDAQRANRAKSAFLANMSHEIRSPINAILGMDEMILRESGEREVLDYAEDIESAGKTLLSIINDILDLSKIEEGKMEILPVQYDLSSLVNDLVNMTRRRAEDKGLRFVVQVDENTPHLLVGDEIRIRQCALNILTNAAKYTERGTVTLQIGYEKLNDEKIMLKLSVSDTGIGMKQEDMDRLFAPFARIEEKRNRNIEGTGLGMSITKQLLLMMGSSLEVQSVYGEGSTFAFAVEQPVAKWEPIGAFAGRYSAGAQRKAYRELFHAPDARILVVDDTPVNLSVIRGLLKRTRMQIDTAESGAEALRKAEDTAYDVIFIDHMMPEMDGVETLHRLRALPGAKTVPCVALTANAISGAREMYLELGFSDYLSKPVDGEKLEKLLLKYLPPEKMHDPASCGAPAPAEDKSARVLIVDDDVQVCHLAQKILGKSCRVEACQNGADAPAAAERLRPDLILLDINLGGMTGFDVLRELRSSSVTGSIPVMFLTGERDEETEIECFRSGAADFVRKPFVPEVLLQRTRRIVALDRLQHGLQSEVRRQTLRAERLSREMMLALSKAVDAKDHYTNGHSLRVAAYAAEIARRMGKTPQEQSQLYEMGLMHDIGKIGVSEDLINKDEHLTVEEFEQIKRHTIIGSEILSLITQMPELAGGARSHHEHYDGTGYPDGLKGTDIPETARILCVADSYDAMTSTRIYSPCWTQDAVREEFKRCSGTQFDPNIAKVMLAMIDEDTDYRMTERTADISVWKGSEALWLDAEAQPQEKPRADDGLFPEDEDSTLPEWLRKIDGLDISVGLRHCGTEETYLETLGIYAGSVSANAEEIERFSREGDMGGVITKVHALKSTSRAIGAAALGDFAERLELAGKAGDTQQMLGGLDELLMRYRALGGQLAPLCAAQEEDESLPLLSEEKVREAYDAMREVLSSMDFDSVEYLANYLRGYRIPESERERCSRILRAADDFDWEKIGELLN